MSVFDEYAQEYDSWYDKNRFSFLSEIEAIKKVLPPGRGVEIGTGSGRFAKELGIKWGVEPSKAMAQMCLRRGVKVEIAQAESLPFASGSFDFALFVTSFCFLKEPLAALREAHRILSPGGCVILGIIDRESFLGKAYGKKKSKFYEEAHFYSAAEACSDACLQMNYTSKRVACLFFCFLLLSLPSLLSAICPQDRHLIPSPSEKAAVMQLDFDGDGVINSEDSDIDGDDIANSKDKDIERFQSLWGAGFFILEP